MGAAFLLAACASTTPAPVADRARPHTMPGEARGEMSPTAPVPVLGPGMVMVKKGDTLRAIALDHGQSYRDIAAWNNLADPDKINVGQVLRVAPPEMLTETPADPVAVAKPVSISGLSGDGETRQPPAAAPVIAGKESVKQTPKGGKQPYSPEALAKLQTAEAATVAATAPSPVAAVAPTAAPHAGTDTKPVEKPPAVATDDTLGWSWPVGAGKILGGFVEGSNKGVDIAGKPGDPVVAAAAGKVILVSNALRGYGNFVIIKHNNNFLSVYAHNSRILVKEEQTVSKGQKIAEVGSSDADQPKLHFEIRRQGKPVDPMKFLPAR